MKWIINNLKMNLTLPEIIEYEKEISKIASKNKIVVCPSLPFLAYFKDTNYHLGSQNVSELNEGSLTGEVSAKQLKSLNVEYVIVGHSERREKLLETNGQVSNKIKLVLENNMTPIICVGEKKEEISNRNEIIKQELIEVLSDVKDVSNIIIAYEPIWAIGTGNIPDISELKETIKFIKNFFLTNYNQEVKVIYGGSVDSNNVMNLNQISELDGYLLGGTSLHIEKFKEIIKKIEV